MSHGGLNKGKISIMNESVESPTTERPHGISRRTIVRGAAWSVPVVAAAAAIPLAAASTTDLCAEVPVNVSAVGHAWTDGNGGLDSEAPYNGSHRYLGDKQLTADFRMRNDGPAVVSGFQVAWTIETDSVNTATPTMVAMLPDGTIVQPLSLDVVDTDPDAPHRSRWIWSFDGTVLLPGETILFRTTYRTVATTPTPPRIAGPYAVGQARTVLCGDGTSRNANDVQFPDDRDNNNATVVNPYYVGIPA